MKTFKWIHGALVLFLLLACANTKSSQELGYQKACKILDRLESTEIVERIIWYDLNNKVLSMSTPSVKDTIWYDFKRYLIKVDYIALTDSGHVLIQVKDACLFYVADNKENIWGATHNDITRTDTLFIKTDTLRISIL